MEHEAPTDADLITLAGGYFRKPGSIDQVVRERYGLSWVAFWAQVNAVIDSPARIGALPPRLWPVVNRLDDQRLRAASQHRRLAS